MLGELVEWVLNLDREFAFLLALPFVVALMGFLSHALTEGRRESRGNRHARAARRMQHASAPGDAGAHLVR